MKNISAVYVVRMIDNPLEIVYIGSTISTLRRFLKEHWNPNYRGHRHFGKWLHENNNLSKVKFEILEIVSNLKGENLKKELRRREFLWKRKLGQQKFGKLDGLKYQPREVQLAVRREQEKRRVLKPETVQRKLLRQREKVKKLYQNIDHQEIDKRNKYLREWNAKRNQNNANFKPRGPRKKQPYCPKRAKKLARRRELHRMKLEKSGKVYKPRASRIKRIEKSLSKPDVPSSL